MVTTVVVVVGLVTISVVIRGVVNGSEIGTEVGIVSVGVVLVEKVGEEAAAVDLNLLFLC